MQETEHEEVEWLEVEETPQKKGRWLGWGLKALAVMAVLGIVSATLLKVVDVIRERLRPVAVARTLRSDQLAKEAIPFYLSYQASEGPSHPADELAELTQLIDAISEASATDDDEGFADLVDLKRLAARVEQAGAIQTWSAIEKMQVRSSLRQTIATDTNWCNLIVVGVKTPADNPESRVVYTLGTEADGSEESECRFLVARTRKGDWRVYDWVTRATGLFHSQFLDLWMLEEARLGRNRQDAWYDAVAAFDSEWGEGEIDSATKHLKESEKHFFRGPLGDHCKLYTGLRWWWLDRLPEAVACLESIEDPDRFSMSYYLRAKCVQERDPERALELIQQYKKSLGPTPAGERLAAEVLAQLNRDEEEIVAWKAVLRFFPSDNQALQAILQRLPADRLQEIFLLLEATDDPVTTAANLASRFSYSDYQRHGVLVNFLRDTAPDAAVTHAAIAARHSLDGQPQRAFESLQRAMSVADDPSEYQYAYMVAAAEAGKLPEAFAEQSDNQGFFADLSYAYHDGDIELTPGEWKSIIDEQRRRAPDDLAALGEEVNRLIEADQQAEALTLLKSSLPKVPPRGEGGEPDYDYQYLREEQVKLLAETGQIQEACAEFGQDPDLFHTAFYWLASERSLEQAKQVLRYGESSGVPPAMILQAKGELAVFEGHPAEAAQHFRAIPPSDSEDTWEQRSRLTSYRQACIAAGDWQTYYSNSQDKPQAFADLADDLIRDKAWTDFYALCRQHEEEHGNPVEVDLSRTEAAWELGDDRRFLAASDKAIRRREEINDSYTVPSLQKKRVTANLRLGDTARAMRIAERESDQDLEALVHAVAGNHEDAIQAAQRRRDPNENLWSIYHHDAFGGLFLKREYRSLQLRHPIPWPYSLADPVAVLHLKDKHTLDQEQLLQAAEDASPGVGEQLSWAISAKSTGCVYAPVAGGEATIFVASGSGSAWRAQPRDTHATWLAVGIAGWTQDARDQAEPIAKRLAASLLEDQRGVVRLTNRYQYLRQQGIENSPSLLGSWLANPALLGEITQPMALRYDSDTTLTASERSYRAGLFDAFRALEAGERDDLRIQVGLPGATELERLWMQVESGKRQYGGVSFRATLMSTSRLVPVIKQGLQVTLSYDYATAWRWGETPITQRAGEETNP